MADFDPEDILAFWFPDDGHWNSIEQHGAFWDWRMQGGADDIICTTYADATLAAAQGRLDHWADTPRGRLALIILLDQFPRSLWRGSSKAYAQDIKATRLAMDAIESGVFGTYAPWERQFLLIAITHCEGPDHLARMEFVERINETVIADLPEALAPAIPMVRGQNARVKEIIRRFGRHPHRNPVYGRISTDAEQAYIDAGDFPHERGTDNLA